jgi:hypothetical protein
LYNKNEALLATSITPVVEPSEELSSSNSSNSSSNSSIGNNFNCTLLPVGLLQLVDSAIKNKIIDFPDVVAVIDSFRWLSWCTTTLHILRSPPTIKTYKKLLVITKYINSANIIDDKILKLLSVIVSKGLIWKQKTRKLLSNSSKKIEITKLNSLLLDSSTIPMMSRLKDSIRDILDRGGKEGSICHIIPVNDNKSIDNKLWSLTSEDLVYSSGDDDKNELSNSKQSKKEYNILTYYSHAAIGEPLWPVQLNIKAVDYKPASAPLQITQSSVLPKKKPIGSKEVSKEIREKDNKKESVSSSESAMITEGVDMHESSNETSEALPPVEATQNDKLSIEVCNAGQASASASLSIDISSNNCNNNKRKQFDIDIDNGNTDMPKSKKIVNTDNTDEDIVKPIKAEKTIKTLHNGNQNNNKSTSLVATNNTTNNDIVVHSVKKVEKKLTLTISRKALVQEAAKDDVIDEANNQVNKKVKKK